MNLGGPSEETAAHERGMQHKAFERGMQHKALYQGLMHKPLFPASLSFLLLPIQGREPCEKVVVL
jgi:hypothetical protein